MPDTGTGESVQRLAFQREPASLGRAWITPGTPGLMHRIGGLEKDIGTGHISYDPANHEAMTALRAKKIDSVVKFIPDQDIEVGPQSGDLLVLGWGSTYGPIYQAAHRTGASFAQLRYLNPLPGNLGALLGRFRTVLVPEMNNGQLAALLRERLGADPVSMTKVSGQPFLISELVERIEQLQREVSA